jgi:predicted NBD/HSP70 family sugar kinase
MRGSITARRVFEAAAAGDEGALGTVAVEARLVAKAICAVTNVVDPPLVVLGGGIGQAPGFADLVTRELRELTPVMPEVRVSVLGSESVVDGCLAAASGLAWQTVVSALPGQDDARP